MGARGIKVGRNVQFDPYAGTHCGIVAEVKGLVNGKIIYVHPTHHYFLTEYEAGGAKFKMSFKFDDVYGDNRSVYFAKE